MFTDSSRRGQMWLMRTRRTALWKSLLAWCQLLNPPSKLLPLHLQSLTLTVPGRKTGPQQATKVRESQRVFSLARSAVGESVFISFFEFLLIKYEATQLVLVAFTSKDSWEQFCSRVRILLTVLSISDLQYSLSEILKVIFLYLNIKSPVLILSSQLIY